MVHPIIWSDKAIETYVGCVEYVEKEFGENEAIEFVGLVQGKIAALSIHPRIGKPTYKRRNMRVITLNKRVVLFYRYKMSKKQVELVRFFNTRQAPKW